MISYGSLTPKRDECENLLVPVSLSSSHIAFGSIRMEPVFMILGQSAAVAAGMAIEDDICVQDVDYAALREELLTRGQVLEWTGPKPQAGRGVSAKSLKGIVVDDDQAVLVGDWLGSSARGPFIGKGYMHDGNSKKGQKAALFKAALPQGGLYSVRLSYSPDGNRATNVRVAVEHADGKSDFTVSQREKPPIDGLLLELGEFRFTKASPASVEILNDGADGHVIIDAVQWVRVRGPE
jgi:hypothetical protein